MNFPVHSYTCCSDRHASPYWTFIHRWILMGFTPSLLKKWMTDALLFGACCKWGHHLYTTTAPSCCIPASYCHLLATLQTMSVIVVNLQDNRTVFWIFITLFKVFIWLSLVSWFFPLVISPPSALRMYTHQIKFIDLWLECVMLAHFW